MCAARWVSVITSISFDHTEQLGNTLGKIAAEKAGIIKPGVPVVSGVVDEEPRQVIAEIARERNSRLVQLGVDFNFDYKPARGLDGDGPATIGAIDYFDLGSSDRWQLKSVDLGLVGRHQAANAAVALATLAELRSQGWLLPEADFRRGLANVRLPARVEIVSRRPTVVIDAAHNVASIQSLLETLDESFAARRRILVFAPTQDKDVRGMLERLLPTIRASNSDSIFKQSARDEHCRVGIARRRNVADRAVFLPQPRRRCREGAATGVPRSSGVHHGFVLSGRRSATGICDDR